MGDPTRTRVTEILTGIDETQAISRCEQLLPLVYEELRGMADRLIIGRFCAIAAEVRFIMNGANHPLDGISTYPFQIFGGANTIRWPLDLSTWHGVRLADVNSKPISSRNLRACPNSFSLSQ